MLFVSIPQQTDVAFGQFWAAYPKRKARKDALKAWQQLRPSPALQAEILEALAWQVTQPDWVKDQGQYIPLPASWLRGERWTDEPPKAPEYRPKFKWCEHEPECGTVTEHTRKWLDEHQRVG